MPRRARVRRRRRGRRAERAVGGDHPGRGRAVGAGRRGRRDRRGRHPLGRADPARLRPRRLLGRPPARRRARRTCRGCPSSATGCAGCSPRSRSPTRSTAAGPAVLHRSVDETAAGLGADGRPTGDGSAGWPSAGTSWRRWSPVRSSGCPGTRSSLTRFGAPGAGPGLTRRAAVVRHRRGPGPVRGLRRPRLPARSTTSSPPRSASCCWRPATPSAGRSPQGGSQAIADALAAHLRELGGEVRTGEPVTRHRPAAAGPGRAVRPGAPPGGRIAGERLPARYRDRLRALPARAGRLQGRLRAVRAGAVDERRLPAGRHRPRRRHRRRGGGQRGGDRPPGSTAERPYVLVAQQSLVDPSRAPAGQHTLWTYCHVPNGSTVDMTERIEAQIERFAPGFRDLVLARHVAGPAWFEAYNPRYVGGDIAGGSHGGLQLVFRPTVRLRPYPTPDPGALPLLGLHAARAPACTACAVTTPPTPRSVACWPEPAVWSVGSVAALVLERDLHLGAVRRDLAVLQLEVELRPPRRCAGRAATARLARPRPRRPSPTTRCWSRPARRSCTRSRPR